jgi:quinol-cytochrome oxidoreductase complex cytochrome b subunit
MWIQSHRSLLRKLATGFLILSLFLGLVGIVQLFSLQPMQGAAPGAPSPTPWMSADLSEPIMPENPRLADKGAVLYWEICMACHGDRGQGLTEEWRERGFGEDANCWQSKCHASNHPPEGFILTRIIPPVVGEGTLNRFVTAEDLQPYLLASMPWWNPKSLSAEDAWALTAYLLRENSVLAWDNEFNPEQASLAPVHHTIRSQTHERIWQWILLACLGLAAAVILARSTFRHKTEASAGPQAHGRTRPDFFHHLHPPTIPSSQARWRYTLGAGGLAVLFSIVLIITGILEMFFYIPTPEQAGSSIQVITFLVPFGGLIRGIHFWAAQALVVITVIHLLRVIFTGAYAKPRRFNFLLGLALLVLVLFLDFTGYVLRWDEGIRWALMVGTNLLKTIPVIGQQVYGFVIGGEQPGLATLIRFYAWHIFGLTFIMAIILTWHLFRVRRDGGVSAPPPELRNDSWRITRNELVRREVLALMIAMLVLILVALLVPAPLAPPIQDAGSMQLSDVNAPWFFMWVQQLLRLGDAFWLGVTIPLGILAILVALPFIFPKIPESQKGRWFPPAGRIAQIIAAIIALAWLALTILEQFQ